MRQAITLLLFITAHLSTFSQTMLGDGNEWYYMTVGWTDYYYQDGVKDDSHKVWVIGSPLNHYVSYNHLFVKGERDLDGKVYKEIWSENRIYHTMYDWDNTATYVLTPPQYVISMREEGDRVFVSQKEYEGFVASLLPALYSRDLSLDDIMQRIGNEYVLYDFATEHGDSIIPHVGSRYALLYPQLTGFANHPMSGQDAMVHISRFCHDGQTMMFREAGYYPNPFFPDERKQDLFPAGTRWEEAKIARSADGTCRTIGTDVYEIGVDTMVNGIFYKTIYKNEELQSLLLRESSGKVWLKTDEFYTDMCLYDFTQFNGTTEPDHVSSEFVRFNPEAFMRMTTTNNLEYLGGYVLDAEWLRPTIQHAILSKSGTAFDYFNDSNGTVVVGLGRVEAIGRNACLLGYLNEAQTSDDGDYEHIYSVRWIEREGRRIFSSDDFNSANDISGLQPSNNQSNIYYNLQGQRSSRPAKGIHIIGGRKVLIK